MSKKKKENKKSPYSTDGKVRIRQSYYTFAEEYPSKILPFEGKRRKNRKQRIIRNCLTGLLCVFLVCLSYFVISLMLDISYTDLETLNSYVSESTKDEEGEVSLLKEGSLKALYMPYEKLGDREYIRNFISQIKRKNANSVVIDFKTEAGKLSYTSLNEYAINGKCALFDNNTVRQALDLFEEKDINVVARIYCFKDSTVSSANPDLAVKYMDTDINWLDGSDENGGVTWLNPLSKNARDYIKSVIAEVCDFDVDGFILEEVNFPTGEFTSGATYPGEKKSTGKNKVLKTFISDIKASLPSDCFLLISHTAKDMSEVNKELYYGEMLTSDTDGFSVNTLVRDEKYIIDKKTDFVSIFSLFSSVKDSAGEKKAVYQIDMSEYSGSYLRKMQKAGYDSFILFSENGEY